MLIGFAKDCVTTVFTQNITGTKVPLSGHRIRTQSFANFVDVELRESGAAKKFAEPAIVVVGPSRMQLRNDQKLE